MQNSPTLASVNWPREATLNHKHWTFAVLTALAISFSTGCGSSAISAPNYAGGQSSAPTQSLLAVSGQYDLVLTSTSGRGTTNIYTNFVQTGGTFSGAPRSRDGWHTLSQFFFLTADHAWMIPLQYVNDA